MFKIYILLTSFLLSASPIWHCADSLLISPMEDSVAYMEEYTTFSVLRAEDTVPTFLWGFTENDTMRSAILTNAYYTQSDGITPYRYQRDFSHWSIYAFHSGIQMDSTRNYSLLVDTCADIKEFVFFPHSLPRMESAAWQTYLALKYGITLDYAPYISPHGDTLWSRIDDYDYYHRIVGVGSDSSRQWVSVLSTSMEAATMQIALPEPLPDGDYILLGDNDGDDSWMTNADGGLLLSRSWRLRQHRSVTAPFSLVWNSRTPIAESDSIRLIASDSWGNEEVRVAPDSIIGDTTCWFTCMLSSPSASLFIQSNKDPLFASYELGVVYDASSGMLSIPSLDPDKIYSYAIYTNVGHLLCRPVPSYPTNINVGALPIGVYSIEAFDGNRMAANLPLLIH